MLPEKLDTKLQQNHASALRNEIGVYALVVLAYVLFATLGLSLASLNKSASPAWPATGFAIAIIYLRGNRFWSAILIGAIASNWQVTGLNPTTFAIGLGNTLEALVGAIILRRLLAQVTIERFYYHTLAFAASSGLASIVSATIGTLSLALWGTVDSQNAINIWLTWWIGDCIGGLVITPIIIMFQKEFLTQYKIHKLLALVALAVAALLVVFLVPGGGPFLFVLFPLILFSARYVNSYSTLITAAIVCTFGIIATAYGQGPFALGHINERLVHLQLFLTAYVLTALTLATFKREHLNNSISAMLLFCWSMAGAIFFSFANSEIERTNQHFSTLIDQAHDKIHYLAETYEEILRGGAGLYLASDSVEYKEWLAYNTAVDVLRNHKGINGLGVVWPVKSKDVAKFESELRKQGMFDFKVTEVPDAGDKKVSGEEIRYIIKYIEPAARNLTATGLDVGSESSRRQAADLSRDTGMGVLSSQVTLVQDEKKTPGSLYFLPIYKKGAFLETVEDRRKAHLGWVYSPIIYRFLFGEIFDEKFDQINVDIYESSNKNTNSLIFSNHSLKDQSYPETTSIIQIGNREFAIDWYRSPLFITSYNTIIAWVGFAGAIATLLLSYLVYSLQIIGSRSREIAEELTRELSESQEKLKEGERRLRYALDGSKDGIWDWDIKKCEMHISGEIARRYGWPNVIHIQTVQDMKDYTHPDDLNEIGRSINDLLSGASDTHEVETRYKTLNGKWRWVMTRGKISERDSYGNPIRMTGAHVDIDDLKKAQQQLESTQYKMAQIASSVPSKISLWNKNFKCEFANQRFAEWLGIPVDKVIGSDIVDHLGQEQFDIRLPFIKRALSGESFSMEMEATCPANGETKYIIATYLPYNMGEQVEGFFHFIQDITDLKLSQLQAIADKKIATEATEVKSQFLANMSHEIRTPLNGILGITKLLEKTSLTDQQKEYAHLVTVSSTALLNIINDILDFSKVEAGKLELETVNFNLRETLESTISTLSVLAKDKEISLELEADRWINEYFIGDAIRIQQILINLISNGIKFTAKGGVKVKLTTQTKRSASRLHFEVEDSGIGIPEEARTRIFDAFSQADVSMTRKFGGTGLGLSICKQLVDLMKGKIGVTGNSRGGSTFWFTIDLQHGVESKLDETPPEINIKSSGKMLKVLLADDNVINQKIAMEHLKSFGFTAETANNGAEVLERLKTEAFDLILMDCQMPVMDGYHATMEIRSGKIPQAQNIPIIALTASAIIGEKEKCLAAGMNGYITKPFKESDLHSAIEQLVSNKSQSKEKLAEVAQPNGHILIVEDNKINQHVASLSLEQLGFSYDIAENGIEALKSLEKEHYDMILMDCQMPEMDGFEATRRIRMNKDVRISQMPIVALTANALIGDEAKCLAAGMNGYLTKPVNIDQLAKAITRWSKNSKSGVVTTLPETNLADDSNTIDLQAIQNLRNLESMGKPGFVNNLIELFETTSQESMDNLRQAIQSNDLTVIREMAHSLKSSSANLGALEFSRICFELEKIGRELESIELAHDLIASLEQQYALVMSELGGFKNAS